LNRYFSHSLWKRGRCSALWVVMTCGRIHRLSPSVSTVMMNAVSGIARPPCDEPAGAAVGPAHHFVERLDIVREYPLLAVLAGHEGAAAIARRLPGGRIVEQLRDGVEERRGRGHRHAQALPLDHTVRIVQRDDGH